MPQQDKNLKEMLPTPDKNLNRWDLKSVKRDYDNSFDKNIPDANSKKIIQSKRFFLLL